MSGSAEPDWAEPLWLGCDLASGPSETVSSLFICGRHLPMLYDLVNGHWRFYEQERWWHINDIANLDEISQIKTLTAEEPSKGVDADTRATTDASVAGVQQYQHDLEVDANALHFGLNIHCSPRQIGKSWLAKTLSSITENGESGNKNNEVNDE